MCHIAQTPTFIFTGVNEALVFTKKSTPVKTSILYTPVLLLSLILTNAHRNDLVAQDEKMVETKITHVTVYANGALVSRQGQFTLPEGESVLTIRNLSPYLNEQSVQVKGKGNYTILSVSPGKNYLENLAESDQIRNLKDQLHQITGKIEDEKMQLDLFREKESFLTANKNIGGRDQSLEAENFRSLYEIYSTNMQKVKSGILAKNRSIDSLKEEQEKIRQQLNQLQSGKDLPSAGLTVVVKARSTTAASLEINYMVNNAGWYPSYDIRVDDTNDPAGLVYKANVYQKTGVEWPNVLLSFSNATPNRSGNVPVLFPWYIDFVPGLTSAVRPYVENARKAAEAMPEAGLAPLKETESMAGIPEVTKSRLTTSVEFNVDIPYTISSSGKPKSIDMMRINVPAAYEYQTVPRLDNDAFLVAGIHDWEQYDLLPGDANIYFENTYVGKSLLDVNNTKDTLDISLGRDQGIIVQREKRKDITGDQFIGGNRIETRSWEISVRNTKDHPVDIRVKDQIPVSKNKEISVEPGELSDGRLDEQTGIIHWDLTLKPGETRKLVFGYTVKYPKDKKITL